MMHQIVVFLSLVWLVCTAMAVTAENLPLNPQASFFRDIQSIQHHAHLREITIELKPVRRCQKPTFRIRISGTSLFIPHLNIAGIHKFVYTYPELLDDGNYFIEVIALLCAPFKPEVISDTCIEDVSERSNVVTLPYTFKVMAENTTKALPRSRWVLPDKNKASLLPTRYQKIDCPGEGRCPSKVADLLQHELYEWVDSANHTKLLQNVLSLSRQEKNNTVDLIVRVCFFGDSHARDLTVHGNRLNANGAEFVYIITIFPNEFNVTWLDIHNCSYAVVSYGLWPASLHTGGHPYTETKYEQEMRRVMTLLQNYDHTRTQVFVHSVNYNALMAFHTSCPPIDFRFPPVIDLYNAVLRKLCKELSIGFIDMNHIVGPMWDGALDWNHPSRKVYTAEVQLILQFVFQSSLQHRRPVSLFPEEVAHAALVRYNDSSSLYLLHHNEIRAFPNEHTFITMGYSFANVILLQPSQRKDVKLGPDLPVIKKYY